MDEAVAQQSIYNTHRVAHPLRNTYVSRHSAKARSFMTQENTNAPVAPAVNDTLRKAARLVAEHHASQQKAQGLLHKSYPQPKYLKGFNAGNDLQKRDSTSSFWVGDITHTGHAPMGADDSYLVSLASQYRENISYTFRSSVMLPTRYLLVEQKAMVSQMTLTPSMVRRIVPHGQAATVSTARDEVNTAADLQCQRPSRMMTIADRAVYPPQPKEP